MTADPSLFDGIVSLVDQAAAAHEYEICYHLLAAALYAGEHAGDLKQVDRVHEYCVIYENIVDAIQPPHHLSKASAIERGNVALFASLQASIEAARVRLKAVAAHEHATRAIQRH